MLVYADRKKAYHDYAPRHRNTLSHMQVVENERIHFFL